MSIIYGKASNGKLYDFPLLAVDSAAIAAAAMKFFLVILFVEYATTSRTCVWSGKCQQEQNGRDGQDEYADCNHVSPYGYVLF